MYTCIRTHLTFHCMPKKDSPFLHNKLSEINCLPEQPIPNDAFTNANRVALNVTFPSTRGTFKFIMF